MSIENASVKIVGAGLFSEQVTGNIEAIEGLREEKFKDMVAGLDELMEKHSKLIWRHSNKVLQVAMEVADFLGIEGEDREALRWSSLLHDVGKLMMNARLFEVSGPDQVSDLGDRAWSRHQIFSAEVLGKEGLGFPERIVKLVASHHDDFEDIKEDPDMWAGEWFLPSVLCLVDGMVSGLDGKRKYQDLSTPDQVKENMERKISQKKIQPKLTVALEEMIERKKKNGSDEAIKLR